MQSKLPPGSKPPVVRRPEPRSGHQATFHFEDGRRLEVMVPGAVALSSTGSQGEAACVLWAEEDVILGDVKSFAALLARKTPG